MTRLNQRTGLLVKWGLFANHPAFRDVNKSPPILPVVLTARIFKNFPDDPRLTC